MLIDQKRSRCLAFTLFTLLFSSAGCVGCESLDPRRLKNELADPSSGVNIDTVKQIRRQRDTGVPLTYEQALNLISGTQLSTLQLEASDSFYLAAPLRNTPHSLCTCALYRVAISTELSRSSLRNLRRDDEEYNRVMLLLRRSVEDCGDPRSLTLQALLASLQGHGHSTLSHIGGSAATAEISLARAISSWYRHDYYTAYQLFSDASNREPAYGGFLTAGSLFLAEYQAADMLERARRDSLETRIDIRWLNATLREALQKRDSAVCSLLLPNLTDFALSAAGEVERPIMISQGARAAQDLLFAVDLIEAITAQKEVIRLSGRRAHILARQEKARVILQQLQQLPRRDERLSLDELSALVKLILLRGELSMEYFDAICTASHS